MIPLIRTLKGKGIQNLEISAFPKNHKQSDFNQRKLYIQ